MGDTIRSMLFKITNLAPLVDQIWLFPSFTTSSHRQDDSILFEVDPQEEEVSADEDEESLERKLEILLQRVEIREPQPSELMAAVRERRASLSERQ